MSQVVDQPRLSAMLSSYVTDDRHPYARPRRANRSLHLLLAMVSILALAPVVVALLASWILV